MTVVLHERADIREKATIEWQYRQRAQDLIQQNHYLSCSFSGHTLPFTFAAAHSAYKILSAAATFAQPWCVCDLVQSFAGYMLAAIHLSGRDHLYQHNALLCPPHCPDSSACWSASSTDSRRLLGLEIYASIDILDGSAGCPSSCRQGYLQLQERLVGQLTMHGN